MKAHFFPKGAVSIAFSFLFFSFLLGVTPNLYGQTCADLGAQFNYCVNSSLTCATTDCFTVQYGCYFKQSGGNMSSTLTLEALAFKATLSKPTGGVSTINVAQTTDCLLNTYGFTADEIEVTQDYVVINKMDGSGPYSFPLTGAEFMAISIDAFPGEALDLSFSDDLVRWNTGTSILNCTLPNTGCVGGGSTTVTVPVPSSCTATSVAVPSISFGSESPTSPNTTTTQYSVPVEISAGGSSYLFKQLDFAIMLAPDHTIGVPTVTAGAISTSNIEIRYIGSNRYIVYVRVSNYTYSPSSTVLFTLNVNGPIVQSTYTQANLSFISGRALRQGDSSCCLPTFGSDKLLEFGQYADCTNHVEIKIEQVTAGILGSDNCETRFLVKLTWPDALGSSLTFNQFKLKIGLTLPSGGSIVGFNNKTLTPSCSGCYSYSGSSVGYSNTSGSFSVTKNDGFEVVVISPDACTGITVLDMVAQVSGSAGCIPTLTAIPSVCPPIIFGTIAREDDVEVSPTTTITVSGSGTENCGGTNVVALDCEKDYSVCACNLTGDPTPSYTVTPTNDYCDVNGVTTFDLVLIQRHITNTTLLGSPYKLIAADANKSNTVTSLDLVEIQKLILSIFTKFPSNTSWRFVDAAYTFPNPANPWAATFPEDKTIPLGTPANFVGVKIGDVNNSNFCGNCAGAGMFTGGEETDNRESILGTFTVNTANKAVKKGEILTIPFTANGMEELVAYQMGLRFDPSKLEFMDASKGDLPGYTKDNLGLTELDKGIIRTLWYTAEEQLTGVVKRGTILFNLRFRAKADMEDVSKLIHLDDSALSNRGYNRDGKTYALALNSSKDGAISKVPSIASITASCYPNPFAHTLSVNVSVAEDCNGSISLFDSFGRRLAYQEVSLTKGENTIAVDKVPTLASGVLNWQVQTPLGKVNGVVVKQ